MPLNLEHYAFQCNVCLAKKLDGEKKRREALMTGYQAKREAWDKYRKDYEDYRKGLLALEPVPVLLPPLSPPHFNYPVDHLVTLRELEPDRPAKDCVIIKKENVTEIRCPNCDMLFLTHREAIT